VINPVFLLLLVIVLPSVIIIGLILITNKKRNVYYDKLFSPLGLIGKSYALGAGKQYEGISAGRKTKIIITRKTKRMVYPAPMVSVAGGTAGVRQCAGETIWITIEAPFSHFVSLVAKTLKGISTYDQMQLNNPITQKIVGGIKDWAMAKDHAKLLLNISPELSNFDVYSNEEVWAKRLLNNAAAIKIALELLNFKPAFGISHFAVKPGCVDFRITTSLSQLSTETIKEWFDAINNFIQIAETIN